MSQITVRHEAGDRFRIAVRGHEVVVDQPAPSSGDAGPTPTELFVASLAACAGFHAHRFLARHGLGDRELTVACDFAWAADHSRVAAISLRIEAAHGFPAALRPALLRVLEHCTVHESLVHVPTVLFDIAAEPVAPVA
ncbi:MAG TPA: OsmC family protein [Candidatus Limnocylindria bacterium]|nr:OsmC family protein [Candidatus Limnocylindria bacterium]